MIRAYTTKDKPELVAILNLLIPAYFARSEEQDFVDYLEEEVEDYFVVEDHGRIIGSGGINYFPDNDEARISWDLIHPDFQGKGIGREVMEFRIRHIRNNSSAKWIVVRTTQLVYPFYQKLGFDLEKTEPDFWAPGFDLVQMKLMC